MKKSFKFLIYPFSLLLLFFFSCSYNTTDFASGNDTNNKEEPKDEQSITFLTYDEAINKLGKVSKVYSPLSQSRQLLPKGDLGIYNNVDLQSNLIEYDSLDPNILKYVESLSEANSYLIQSYGGKDEYVEGKTYVEFASFTDVDNGKVIMFDVRVFRGDFWKSFTSLSYYAKEVAFSPDLKIDIRKNKNIETNEDATYEYPYAIKTDPDLDPNKWVLSECNIPSLIGRIGEVSKAYNEEPKEGENLSHVLKTSMMEEGKTFNIDVYAIEFNSLKDKFISFLEHTNNPLPYYLPKDNLIKQNGKKYIEYLVYTNAQTNIPEYYGIRIEHKGIVQHLSFKDTTFNSFLDFVNNNKTLAETYPLQTSITDSMKKIGEFDKYYDRYDAVNRSDTSEVYEFSRLYEYSSLTPKTLSLINALKDKSRGGQKTNYNCKQNNNKRYVELIIKQNMTTNEITEYELRIKDDETPAYFICWFTKDNFYSFVDQAIKELPEFSYTK